MWILSTLLGLGCPKKDIAMTTDAVEETVTLVAIERLVAQYPSWNGTTIVNEDISLDFSVHFSIEEGQLIGSMDIPVQNAFDFPLEDIIWTETELSFVLKPPQTPKFAWAEYHFAWNDSGTLEGELQQMKQHFPTVLSAGAKRNLNRPQTPNPPFEYSEEEFQITVQDGASLVGTLVVPKVDLKPDDGFPLAVLITGSGPQDRDETVFGHKPFAVIADHLAKEGIASLRLDDRGVGESTLGDENATTLTFAQDIQEVLQKIKNHDQINAQKIGLIGHSEGGLIAGIVASENDAGIDFVVMMAGPGIVGIDLMVRQHRDMFQALSLSEEQLQELDGAYRSALLTSPEDVDAEQQAIKALVEIQMSLAQQELDEGALQPAIDQFRQIKQSAWFQTFLSLDPAAYFVKIQAPVLVLNGAMDIQVASDVNVSAIESLIKSNGNNQVQSHILPNLNHLFQNSKTGNIAEYGVIEETIDPMVLDLISDWILAQ